MKRQTYPLMKIDSLRCILNRILFHAEDAKIIHAKSAKVNLNFSLRSLFFFCALCVNCRSLHKKLSRSFFLAFIILLLQGIAHFAIGQNVKIKRIELVKNKVIVTYDLEDSNPNSEYQLNLYTSKDNYTVPMTKVKGDVGNEIKVGTNKKIEWRHLR
jgi:hypothetical protein